MKKTDHQIIRQLFDDYIRMYSLRDDVLTTHFSDNFSGFTGGGDFLVKDKDSWIAITRQDFAQIKNPIGIEIKDTSFQSLSDTIVVATGFFAINLPFEDHVLTNETARLVLIFRLESTGWKISHSSISIPFHLIREGEIYPMEELAERNQFLQKEVATRTAELSKAKESLEHTNEKLKYRIAKHKLAEQQIQKLVSQLEIERDIAQLNATTDSLTGLANRRCFDDSISGEFCRLKSSGDPLSIIMMDIDYFKKFNDFYGHLAGDNCLESVGAALKNVTGRVSDIIARYGGEEFIMLLPGTDSNGAITIAERIKQVVEDLAIPHTTSKTANHLTISLGVATIPSVVELTTIEQVVAMADTALYSAKQGGRNRYVVFTEDLN
ncbi:MAG: diguanylate cyclase [Desulfotalea sp.]